jgi:hypothetical protein
MTVRSAALAAVFLSLVPGSLTAQERGTIAGLMGGYTTTTQLWQPATEVEEVGGVLLGAFVEAATPLGWLSLRAEAAYTQRGGNVLGDVQGRPMTSGIRSDYVAVAVHAGAALTLGRLRLQLSAGPGLDLLIRSRIDPTLAPVLRQEGSTVFGVGAGIGLGVRVTERVFAEIEARIFEGLADAYVGDFVSMRNRSLELVGRVGVPVRR